MRSVEDDKDIIDKAWDLQYRIEGKINQIGKGKYGRVLKMARNPTNQEYAKTSKIVGVGILIIGGLGFFIYLLSTHMAPMVAEWLGWIE